MCGIAGVILGSTNNTRDALAPMVAAQWHRGPDDDGTCILPFGRGTVGLGHRRLAILDLSSVGHQPMMHRETGNVLVFNGEIYNFRELRARLKAAGERFRGSGDTEVLLAGLSVWGAVFLTELEGMFALAFYDQGDQQLLLARDPLGIKPLYWTRANSVLAFSSEVRALLASGLVSPEPHREGVAEILAYGAAQTPATLYKGIEAFPAGCWVNVRAGERNLYEISPTRRHWTFPKVAPIDPQVALSRVREVVAGAVQSHMVSDVPVGVFLSSGLDSTVITGLAAKGTTQVRTFTVGFGDNPDYSESTLAAETARQFGLDHVPVNVNMADALEQVSGWLASIDQPSLDGLNTYVIAKAVRREGIIVALSGQGGDELFGGYPSFRDVPRIHSLFRLARLAPMSFRSELAHWVGRGSPTAVREKMQDLARSNGDLRTLYLLRRRVMSNEQMEALGFQERDIGPSYISPAGHECEQVPMDDRVAAISLLELKYYLGNTLLRVGDESGMANSMEIRVPLLDRCVLDAVLAMPGTVRLPNRVPDKFLLRRAFSDFYRPELLGQAKRGFELPVARWMRGSLRDLCEDALSSLRKSGLCDPDGVAGVWDQYLAEPETQIWSRVWSLCVLGNYLSRKVAS